MCTLGLFAMIPSTIDAVPSGDPSSTMTISSRASCDSAVSIRRAMFSRSLYVGTMIMARSAPTPAPSGLEGAGVMLFGERLLADDIDPASDVGDRGHAARGVEVHPDWV